MEVTSVFRPIDEKLMLNKAVGYAFFMVLLQLTNKTYVYQHQSHCQHIVQVTNYDFCTDSLEFDSANS